MRSLSSFCLHAVVVLSAVIALAACGGGGSGGNTSANDPSVDPAAGDPINGSGVKGPLTNAIVSIYNFDGTRDGFREAEPIATGATDAAAAMIGVELPRSNQRLSLPMIVELTSNAETRDLSTGQPPVLRTLRTVITADRLDAVRAGAPVYATPLTTLAVDLAIARSGPGASAETFAANLASAASLVKASFGFGMSQTVDLYRVAPVLKADATSLDAQSQVAEYRTAIEATAAVIVELRKSISAVNRTSSVSNDQILAALALDLADGTIDGARDGDAPPALRDISDIDAVVTTDPATLTVPDTNISLNDIEQILIAEAELTCGCNDAGAVSNYLADGSVDVQPAPVVVIVDADLDTASRPRVVGAISTGNTSVLVTFTKPMSQNAIVPAFYELTQAINNEQVARLPVIAARFADGAKDAVILTTGPQQELLYRMTVTNVTDTNGRQIDIVAAFNDFVFANFATFTGTPPSQYLACDALSFGALAGTACSVDADCRDPASPDVGAGQCTLVSDFIDSDFDGITDDKELRGYTITVAFGNGIVEERVVTSDPYRTDTDGDGINDQDELRYGGNPRDADTDGDGLDDNLELNSIYSSPYMADSDGDGLEDSLEFDVLQTSPILADTDGDQLADDVELFERFRNPRIADLPELALVPGNHTIVLNEAFTYTDASGNEVTTESSSLAQLGTGSSEEVLDIDETVKETIRSVTGNFTLRGGLSEQDTGLAVGNPFIWGQAEVGFDRQDNTITTTGTDTVSTRESQRVLEESYSKGRLLSTSSEVVRDVQSAILNVELYLRNRGDMAFSVTDLEVTILRQRPGTRELEPLATLSPNAGSDAVFSLGPFNGEIGPLVFSDQDFPVGLAEELMRNPAGIAFRIANYSIVDEFGRRFSYINQEVKDVTAGLVIDYGFEGVDRYQIAASGLKDLTTGNALGMFDALGRPTGLPLTFLLQNQLGWERNPTTEDAIIAGVDGVAQTAALGDDVQRVAVGTRGLGIGEVIIEAGPNGRLDSTIDPDSSNTVAVTRGFDTSATCGNDAPVIFQGRKACSAASQCVCTEANGCPTEVLADAEPGNTGFVNAQCNGPQIITRVGGYENKAGSYRWIALTDADLTTSADVDSIIMKPGESFKLAFVQDLDEDGLFGREEFMEGTTDSPVNQEDNVAFGDTYRKPAVGDAAACEFQALPEFCGDEANQSVRIPLADSRDTDRDGMEDAVELELGWEVAVNGQTRRKVYSSPILRDSDGDGLTDWQERDIRFSCGQQFYVAGENRQVDGDYFGPLRQGEFAFSDNTIVAYPADYQNQRLLYPDPFIMADFPADLLVAGDLASQMMDYVDSNSLLYIERIAPYCQPDVPDPATADPDDYISRAVSLDPQNVDTDGDGIEDGVELMGYDVNLAVIAAVDFVRISGGQEPVIFITEGDDVLLREFSVTIAQGDVVILPGPNGRLDADYAELYQRDIDTASGVAIVSERLPQRIRSNPLDTDSDDDLLSDGAERALGTNPVLAGDVGYLQDSDGDGVFDIDESRGLVITVNGASYTVRSNPAQSDTDGDGLPDFVEYQVGSNPSNVDTDGDGLSDYDEFSTGQFARFAVYVDRFDTFVLDAAASMQYGTLLNNSDSDNDGLSDGEEVAGFSLITLRNGSPISLFVQTNPLSDDTDADGLADRYELETAVYLDTPNKMTNPVVADTDGDGIDDGREAANNTDPLVADRRVTVRYYELSVYDSSERDSDWDWVLRIQEPGELAPGSVVNTDEDYADSCLADNACNISQTSYISPLAPTADPESGSYMTIGQQYLLASLPPAASRSFTLSADQYFALSGIVLQVDIPTAGQVNFSCISEFDKTLSYDDLAAQTLINGEVDLSEGTCSSSVRYTISVSD